MKMSSEFEKYAVYWVPTGDDPLDRFGAAWTGWCTEEGAPYDRSAIGDLGFDVREVTRKTCRHGLHGVLMTPFSLGPGRSRFVLEHFVGRLAESVVVAPLPPLRLAVVSDRVALVPSRSSPAIVALATRIGAMLPPLGAAAPVHGFADATAPARLGVTGAGPVVELPAFGAPTFHMPLTDRLEPRTATQVLRALEPLLRPALAIPRQISDIALMYDPGEGRPLRLLQRYELRKAPLRPASYALPCVGPDLLEPMPGDPVATSSIAI